jgi:O-antigen/teichoic acid export membrane protein
VTTAPPEASSEHRSHLEKLARRGTASVVGAGFSAAFGILLVVVVTNGFSATVAGTLFASTSAFIIVESFALLGTDTGLVRLVPAQLASGRARDVPRTLVISAVPVLGFALVISLVLYFAAPSLAPHLVGTGSAANMAMMLQTLALVLPVAALYDLVVAATRGTGSMMPTVLVDNLGRLGLQAGLILVVFLAGGGPRELVLAWSLPYVAGLVAGCLWLRRMVAARVPPGARPTPWRVLTREFWAYTAPRAIARVTQTALKRSDIVMVAALASPAEAALYTAATRFIVLGQLFVQSVQQALSPHLSSLFAKGDKDAATSVYRAATLWSMIAAWPLYLVLAGFSRPLMGVFGQGYDVATDVVLILSLTMLLATGCGPVDSVLLMAGRSWVSLRNSTVALAVNVGLNFVLIPLLGIRGAAISWAVAIVVRNLLPLMIVHRQLGMWPVTRATVWLGAGAIVCFGVVDSVTAVAHPPGAVGVALLAIAAVVYLVGIGRWRADLGLDAFRSAVRRRGRSSPYVPESGDETVRVAT